MDCLVLFCWKETHIVGQKKLVFVTMLYMPIGVYCYCSKNKLPFLGLFFIIKEIISRNENTIFTFHYCL